MSDELILVNEHDRVLGHLDKERCHDGDGVLHRAFSIFLVDEAGRHLVQKRSSLKRLWPRFWSNSCCSHPRRGEDGEDAAHRRLHEELGIRVPLRFLYRFEYQASFADQGSEHELCSVFTCRATGDLVDAIRADPDEIHGLRWAAPAEIDDALDTSPESYTPWFHLEWCHLRDHFPELFVE